MDRGARVLKSDGMAISLQVCNRRTRYYKSRRISYRQAHVAGEKVAK